MTPFGACCFLFNKSQVVRNDLHFVAGERDRASVKCRAPGGANGKQQSLAEPALPAPFQLSGSRETVIQNIHIPASGYLGGTHGILLPITSITASCEWTPLLLEDLPRADFLRGVTMKAFPTTPAPGPHDFCFFSRDLENINHERQINGFCWSTGKEQAHFPQGTGTAS